MCAEVLEGFSSPLAYGTIATTDRRPEVRNLLRQLGSAWTAFVGC